MSIGASILKQLKFRLSDEIDFHASRGLDIQDVESVCLTLGPYRNLTTLTASALFLHPNCQVLNHAGGRIFGSRVDFFCDYKKRKFDRFIQFAIKISSKGQRGNLGGSITHSHAFNPNNRVTETFKETGLGLTKKQIQCLFWKESLHTSNLIRERNVDLGAIFENDDRLRFLLPIRHPLDCAVSNLETGHASIFRQLSNNASIFDVVQAVLDEIFWFAGLKKRFPERFFYFLEHEISQETLVNLASFLQLAPNDAWVENAFSVMKIKPGYDHDSELLRFYRSYIIDKGSKFPELSKSLLAFVD